MRDHIHNEHGHSQSPVPDNREIPVGWCRLVSGCRCRHPDCRTERTPVAELSLPGRVVYIDRHHISVDIDYDDGNPLPDGERVPCWVGKKVTVRISE